ncbi:MAG: ATP-binding cassette domain-containing protein [Candidatus Tectomicrobia bacterium]|uniref:ATP-binding cassette domain-containing protein n=1 Tax=Tectimicrobiota bacterium TaxID=2528274 RepID=A0A933GMF4_UNCTE|nr:ATP-binding cassette domain-containing protein [Candidatus Tectomicrobia bacterium]
MIQVKQLTKRFGQTVAVKNVSFSVEKGQILGFLGPNGAGKTTTMRILTCYIPADEGSASIAGLDVFENSLEVREKIGYLPENAPLYPDMGVIDYLNFIAEMREITGLERKKRLREMIDICGLEKALSKQIGQLSKGYRQRVGLAQTLIHHPDVLILDEPTTGLDPNQIMEIRQLIKEVGKEKTVILCSHILPEVEVTCQRVIIINEGEIVASGTPEELTNKALGGQTIFIKIKGPKGEIDSKLNNLPGLVSFRKSSEEGHNFYRYEIKGDGHREHCEDLFRMAVDNNWILSELRMEGASLEDVFRQLTAKEK